MKKIMSVIMLALVAICGSVMFSSCGDDDKSYDSQPTVTTTEYDVKAAYANITGKVVWNDNKSSKDAGFYVWGSVNKDKVFYPAKATNNDVFTTLTCKVEFTTTAGNRTINIYDPGETVYYQAVVRNVSYNKSKTDVMGNTMNFTVPNN